MEFLGVKLQGDDAGGAGGDGDKDPVAAATNSASGVQELILPCRLDMAAAGKLVNSAIIVK